MAAAEKANIEKTTFSRKVRQVFGLDLHSWEQLMLVSLGVAGLIAIAVFVTTASVMILQRDENARTKLEFETYKLDAGKKIAEANAQGDQARAAAAGSMAVAAEAQRQARRAELELVRFRRPRHEVLAAARDSFVSKLKLYSGVQFDIGMNIEREVQDLVWNLEPAFWDAGWKQVDWIGPPNSVYSPVPGRPALRGRAAVSDVSIEVHPESREQFREAVEALAAALKEIGIEATTGDFNVHNNNPAAIHVLVGTKR